LNKIIKGRYDKEQDKDWYKEEYQE